MASLQRFCFKGTLTKSLKAQGDFCFAYRSYLPLFLLPMLLVVLLCFGQNLVIFDTQNLLQDSTQNMQSYTYAYNKWLIWLSIVVGFIGEGIRMFVAGFAARGTSGRNTKGQVADELNTTGAYSLCRNPLYLGNFLMMLAPVILLGNVLFVVIFVLAFWLYYERIIFAEESFLSAKFGSAYEEWANKTPCFLPDVNGFIKFIKPKLPLSISTIIRKEFNSIYGLVCSLFFTHYIIAIFGYYALNAKVRGGGDIIAPECVMSVLFVGSSVAYIVVRFLVKKTSVFASARV